MGKVIAVVNQKGGVAKTTSTLNLGIALAEQGKRVLLIDLDPQAHLSLGLGVELEDGQPSLHHLLFDDRVALGDVLKKDVHPGVDLIPSDINLSAADLQLVNELNRERVLKRHLKDWKLTHDFVLIDNPPSLSLLVINALTAASHVLVPVQAAFWSLKGLDQLTATVERVKKTGLNPRLELLGVLVTMADPRTSIHKKVCDKLQEVFGRKVFETQIKKTVQVEYATVAQKPLVAQAPNSDVAQAYRAVAQEVINRVEKA